MIKQIKANCEIKVSPKCLGSRIMLYKGYLRNKKINNGQFLCKSCTRYNKAMNGGGLKHKVDTHFFNKIDTELKAYMLGIIAGDGNLKNNTFRVVANATDIETLKLFKKHISKTAKLAKYKGLQCYYICITSAEISSDICRLLKIQAKKKSNIISLPKLNECLTWHFIRGLMDSDGSITDIRTSKRSLPACSYASMSPIIKRQIKYICDDNDISYTCDKISIKFNGKNAINFLNKIYDNSIYYLSRKKNIYDLVKTWVPQKGYLFRPRKIRKDKGQIKGPKFLSEEGRKRIIMANKKRRRK